MEKVIGLNYPITFFVYILILLKNSTESLIAHSNMDAINGL